MRSQPAGVYCFCSDVFEQVKISQALPPVVGSCS
jgi:hypothetical protein